ncbi:beta strand repeat-containing protein [Eubacterium callanderi]|uniref:beta strand repeat-containing protein n=1 Tax=Eubacterium callanderi TaxID=53442 RepID=UPI0034A2B0C3
MKAKLKDKRLLLTAVFFCALAAMFLWSTEVKAAGETGDFTVTGGTLGTDYSYDSTSGVLTVNGGANLTIKNTNPGTATGNRIVVAGNASITLSGVNIEVSGGSSSCAFNIQTSASVNLTLSGENTLKNRYGGGLFVPEGAALTIGGTAGKDSLTATSGSVGAGIGFGNYDSCGKITITGGSVKATGVMGIGGWGDKGDQTVEIKGGEVEANSIGGGSTAVAISGGTVTTSENISSSGLMTISSGTVKVGKNINSGTGTVTITGGTVTTGENIGGTGSVTVSGGTVDTHNITANTLAVTNGKVTAETGIKGGTLNVSGGTLTASGENEKAAINSDVTISGGSVTANGGSTAAGIGGNNGEAGKNVTISGGMVIATGGTGNGLSGAGIGGGNKEAGGKVTISGGKVVAKGGDYAAGIGGGRDGKGADVIITGGSGKASSIGGGGAYGGAGGGSLTDGKGNSVTLKTFTLQDSSGSPVTDTAIDAFTIPTYGIKDVRTDTEGKLYFYLPNSITDGTPVTVTADSTGYEGSVSGSATLKPFAGDIDLSQGSGNLYIWGDGYMRGGSADESAKKTYTGDYTLTGGTAESATANTVTVMGDYNGNPVSGTEKTITLNGVNIDVNSQSYACAFSIQAGTGAGTGADVNLMLSGGNTLKSGSFAAGLGVPEGASVTIDSVPDTGRLTATGADAAAGIGGGNNKAGGTVTINGGIIDAIAVSRQGTGGGAGIGGGASGAGGDITINGGKVTAAGCNSAAGIGGGYRGAGGAVTINGGSVVAKGDGAGIGTGDQYTSSDFGTVTISGGTVTATGGDSAAGIGGGYQVSGEDVKITGGSIAAMGGSGAEAIGHGTNGSGSGTLTDGSGNDVYLNTLTVGEGGQSMEIAVENEVTIDGATNYGTTDVTTMDGGKLYFYLPNNTTNPEIAVTHDGTTYSRNYQRNSAARANTYTATLLPPPTYTITIPEKVDFDSPTYQPAGSGQYNDKTFEVIPTTLTNLTDGRGLSVMVKDGGTSPSTGTDYQLTGSDSSDTLNYQVYQGASATGSALDAAGATLVNKWEKAAGGSLPSAQSGTLRLDQTQIKYSGSYTGTLTFTVNVVDSK